MHGDEFAYTSEHGELVGRVEVHQVEPPANPYSKAELRELSGQPLDSTRVPRGRSLAKWLRDEGWTFDFPGPDGRKHEVTLEAWRGCDADSTHIAVLFHGVPRERYDAANAAGKDPFDRGGRPLGH